LEVINNLPAPLQKAEALLTLFNLDGTIAEKQKFPVNAAQTSETAVTTVDWPKNLSQTIL